MPRQLRDSRQAVLLKARVYSTVDMKVLMQINHHFGFVTVLEYLNVVVVIEHLYCQYDAYLVDLHKTLDT